MWWSGNALGFDIESDGKDPLDARIITAATVSLAKSDDTTVAQEMELMLKPEREIPAEATGVHGITTERAEREGTDRAPGIALLAGTIADLAGPDRPLVGHNLSYDLTVLDRELRRLGTGFLICDPVTFGDRQVGLVIGNEEVTRFPVIDTYVLDKAVDRYRPGSRKLEAVARHYGVAMAEGSAHGATADVVAALRIAITIANRCAMPISAVADLYMDRRYPMKVAESFYDLGALALPDLHAAQVRWAREQAAGLREHFISQGKIEDAKTVDGSWPLRTLTDGVSPVETIDTTLV